jgi:hypothetical protein
MFGTSERSENEVYVYFIVRTEQDSYNIKLASKLQFEVCGNGSNHTELDLRIR